MPPNDPWAPQNVNPPESFAKWPEPEPLTPMKWPATKPQPGTAGNTPEKHPDVAGHIADLDKKGKHA